MGSVIDQVITDKYALYNGDCVEVAQSIPSESVDYSIFSPPFASLYTYSDDEKDMGNSRTYSEFFEHYKFLIKEQFRIMKAGRNISIHCMNLPTSKQNDGFIGINDFRGDLIRAYQDEGFIYHSEVCIWKCPVVAMTRTHALGLLHAQIKKDSAMSRMGIPDYVITMRKPGENLSPVTGEFKYYCGESPPEGFIKTEHNDGRIVYIPSDSNTSVDVWQKYASPVWDDISQTDTLNFREGRHSDDERHICPLQLDVIERCLTMWSLENETIWTPFLGIGSEAYMSVKMGRKAIGSELKSSYFNLAKRNVEQATKSQYEMFS